MREINFILTPRAIVFTETYTISIYFGNNLFTKPGKISRFMPVRVDFH